MTLPNVTAIGEAIRADELSAAMSLRATTTREELASVWSRDCDHFTGYARERLQSTYAEKLRSFGALQP